MYISDITLFKNKTVQKRTLHNDKTINPTRRYNTCKYISTQASIHIYTKQILTNIKGEVDSKIIVIGTLTLHLFQ